MYSLTLIVVVSLLFTTFSAYIDYEHISNKQYFKDHSSRWILRTLFVSTIAIFEPCLAVISALLFWVFFDQILNLLLDKDFFYTGRTSKIDMFFSEYKRTYVILKLFTLFITTVLIYLYNG